MTSKTTITVETVKQIRIRHATPQSARSCPFCGAETMIDPNGRETVCEIVETAASDPLIHKPVRSKNNE